MNNSSVILSQVIYSLDWSNEMLNSSMSHNHFNGYFYGYELILYGFFKINQMYSYIILPTIMPSIVRTIISKWYYIIRNSRSYIVTRLHLNHS